MRLDVQTFLPYPSFLYSAGVLDRQRLGKQRVEALQLLRVHAGITSGWSRHPAVRMWKGHERWLLLYGVKICDEWIARGYRDTCRTKMLDLRDQLPGDRDQVRPEWLGDDEFHRSHQSNLVRKLPDFYRPLFRGVPDNLPYIWPRGIGAL